MPTTIAARKRDAVRDHGFAESPARRWSSPATLHGVVGCSAADAVFPANIHWREPGQIKALYLNKARAGSLARLPLQPLR